MNVQTAGAGYIHSLQQHPANKTEDNTLLGMKRMNDSNQSMWQPATLISQTHSKHQMRKQRSRGRRHSRNKEIKVPFNELYNPKNTYRQLPVVMPDRYSREILYRQWRGWLLSVPTGLTGRDRKERKKWSSLLKWKWKKETDKYISFILCTSSTPPPPRNE